MHSLSGHPRLNIAAALVTLLCVSLATLGGDRLPGSSSEFVLQGELRIVGSRSMRGLIDAWVEIFRQRHPQVVVHKALYGSGTAAGALEEELADIAPLAREMSSAELAMFIDKRFKPEPVQVGYGSFSTPGFATAVAVYVHRDNPVKQIRLDQLARLLSANGPYPDWKDIAPKGSNAPQCSVRLYGIGWPSGTHEFLKLRLLGDRRMRKDMKLLPNAQSVGPDKCALGFGSPGNAPAGTRVIAVAESAGQTFVKPSERTVANGAYPLARPIYLYVNQRDGAPISPAAGEFLRIALSKEGQARIRQTPYFPLPQTAFEFLNQHMENDE